MKLEFLQRKFWAATRQCSTVDGPCTQSCEDSDLDCFVIDNNGFILISKRSRETGRFLGEVDGAVLTQLLSMGVFSQVTMYDYQAMCKPSSHHHSAAQPLVSPISAFLTATRWLLQELVLFLLEWSVWGSWYDRGAEAHKHKKQDQLQPCDTEYPVFVYQPAIQEANGIIECGPCQKNLIYINFFVLPKEHLKSHSHPLSDINVHLNWFVLLSERERKGEERTTS
ncbi:CACNA2D4 isoform 22 [Pan troglodytes]|uniref:CACNA2D4 isoform 22 n=1 Tax=Pan troglodytes TaxID=9598 RepID=A0A2J8KMF8_PANTR|nr:CACNA2D4 isoform 22 [Pan troglodytes]